MHYIRFCNLKKTKKKLIRIFCPHYHLQRGVSFHLCSLSPTKELFHLWGNLFAKEAGFRSISKSCKNLFYKQFYNQVLKNEEIF